VDLIQEHIIICYKMSLQELKENAVLHKNNNLQQKHNHAFSLDILYYKMEYYNWTLICNNKQKRISDLLQMDNSQWKLILHPVIAWLSLTCYNGTYDLLQQNINLLQKDTGLQQ